MVIINQNIFNKGNLNNEKWDKNAHLFLYIVYLNIDINYSLQKMLSLLLDNTIAYRVVEALYHRRPSFWDPVTQHITRRPSSLSRSVNEFI